jgi:hypothetical protein
MSLNGTAGGVKAPGVFKDDKLLFSLYGLHKISLTTSHSMMKGGEEYMATKKAPAKKAKKTTKKK